MSPRTFSQLNIGEISTAFPVRHTRKWITRRMADFRFFLRLLLHPYVTSRLFWPKLAGQLSWSKCLLWPTHGRKVQRPYLARYYSRRDRIDLLLNHYALTRELGLYEFSHGLKDHCVVLDRLESKSGTRQYNIVLAPAPEGYCEGELLLNLTDETQIIYSISFSFVRKGEKTYLQVGCIQGGKKARELIATATRELQGCCPRFLLMAIARGLSQNLGLQGVILVGNDNRVTNLKADKTVLLDYDKIWRELGAEPVENGDYFIGHERIYRQDFSDLPSKKRSEAKRKAELVKSTIQNVTQTFLRFGSNVRWLDADRDLPAVLENMVNYR